MIESFLFLMARVFFVASDWFLSKALSAKNKRIEDLRPTAITCADFRDFYQDNPPGTSKQAMADLEQKGMEGVHLYDLDSTPLTADEQADLAAYEIRMKSGLVSDTEFPGHRAFVREGKVVLEAVADPTWGLGEVPGPHVCGEDYFTETAVPGHKVFYSTASSPENGKIVSEAADALADPTWGTK